MPRVEFYTAVETGDWVTAGVTIAVAFVAAEIVDRALKRRGKRLSSAVAVGDLSPVATTRLRLVRRLVFAMIIVIGLAVAGIMLAITQPIRLGDLVTVEDETGEVEDVRLTYTYIRLDDGRRLIVPNELLAQSSIENHTVVDPSVQVEVSVWIPPGADADLAIELVSRDGGIDAAVAEVDKEGVRLVANT